VLGSAAVCEAYCSGVESLGRREASLSSLLSPFFWDSKSPRSRTYELFLGITGLGGFSLCGKQAGKGTLLHHAGVLLAEKGV
jgi:hypothetical protein